MYSLSFYISFICLLHTSHIWNLCHNIKALVISIERDITAEPANSSGFYSAQVRRCEVAGSSMDATIGVFLLGYGKLYFSFPFTARPYLRGLQNFPFLTPEDIIWHVVELKLLWTETEVLSHAHPAVLVQVGMDLVNVCIYDMCCGKSLTLLANPAERWWSTYIGWILLYLITPQVEKKKK